MKDRDTKEIEQCFLGSLLLATENGKVETRLQTNDFKNKKYGRIYETIMKQWDAGTTPTIATLCDELAPDIPVSEIAELTNKVPSAANITYYETQIFEASKTRLFLKAIQIAKDEIDRHTDTDTVIKNFIPALTAVTTARNETIIKTAAELLNMRFPEIRWIVPGLIGEGLTLINGAPKIGKSWFVLNLAIAATAGGNFLGTLPVEKTDTLYLALEDTDRRLNNRLKKLKSPENCHSLKITTQWRDGYTGLEYYLKENRNIGLVIIDTLARFTNIKDFNEYAQTTAAMTQLKHIADGLNIAIVLIHHAKKTGSGNSGTDWMEAVLGSTGLTGATDSTIFISRDRKKETKNSATLYATGRDTMDITHILKFDIDFGGWIITETETPADKEKKPGVNGKKVFTRDDIQRIT